MSSNTFTVKTAVQSAQPRSKRLRGLAGDVIIGSGSAGVVAGSVGEGHSHANKSLLDSLLSDEEGYLYIVGKTEDSDDSIAAKILAGSADKWAGHAWEEYMDQPLRSSDDVVFASVAVEKVVFTNGAILEVDGDYIKINKVLYSTKNLAVLGEGEDVPGGGGGASYNRLDTWNGYDNSTMAGYVLSAALGYDINIRLTTLENSGLTGDYLPSTTKYALSDKVGGDAVALCDGGSGVEGSVFLGGLTYSSVEMTEEDDVPYSKYIPVFTDDSEAEIRPMSKTNVLKMLGFKVMSDGKPALAKKCSLWGNDFDGTADVNGRLSIEPETDGSVISIGNGYGDEGGGIFTYSYGGDEGKRVIFLYAGTSQDQDALNFTQGIALYDNGKIRLNAAPGFAVFNNSPAEDIEMWGTFGGYLTKIKFSNGATIEVDGDYLKVTSVLYSTKNVAVLGEGENVPGGGGGGGASYNRLDTWEGYDNSTMAGYVLSAGLGFDINNRLTALENNGGGSTGNYLPSTTKYALSDKVGGDAMALYDYSQATATSATIAFIGGLSYSNEKLTNDDSVSSYVPIFFDDSEPTLQPMHKTEFLKFLGFTVGTDDKPVVGGDITDTLLTLWNNYSLEIQDKWALSAGLGYQLYQKAHTHSNKSVLDTITSAMVNKWNKDYLPTTTKYALSDAVGGDALQAKKLTWQRIIGLSGAVQSNGAYFDGSQNISIPVNYIYDDYVRNNMTQIANNTVDFNPLIKLWIDANRGNQFAFINPDAVTVQYTRDGGTTWTDYYPQSTDDEKYVDKIFKNRFFSGINTNLSNFYILGKASNYSELSNLNQLRIEIDTTKAHVDFVTRFFVVYVNRHGDHNVFLTIEKRHTINDNWVKEIDKLPITGGPSYNKINLPSGGIRTDVGGTGTNTVDTYKWRYIRFTFTQEIGTYQNYGAFVYNIYAFGDTYNYAASNMARKGNLYDYDEDQNMKLPAGIVFSNGCSIKVDGDKLKVHGTIYSDSNVAVKTE